jgi:hypothetical protein
MWDDFDWSDKETTYSPSSSTTDLTSSDPSPSSSSFALPLKHHALPIPLQVIRKGSLRRKSSAPNKLEEVIKSMGLQQPPYVRQIEPISKSPSRKLQKPSLRLATSSPLVDTVSSPPPTPSPLKFSFSLISSPSTSPLPSPSSPSTPIPFSTLHRPQPVNQQQQQQQDLHLSLEIQSRFDSEIAISHPSKLRKPHPPIGNIISKPSPNRHVSTSSIPDLGLRSQFNHHQIPSPPKSAKLSERDTFFPVPEGMNKLQTDDSSLQGQERRSSLHEVSIDNLASVDVRPERVEILKVEEVTPVVTNGHDSVRVGKLKKDRQRKHERTRSLGDWWFGKD